jgi:hypothetical protein
MRYDETHDEQLLPFDATTITGIRIDGSPGVTAVDTGTAEVVVAAGETWLHWELNGVHHAVSSRHITELISKRPTRRVIDLTAPADDYTRLRALQGSLRG